MKMTLPLVGVMACLVSACSMVSDEDAESSEQETRVKPKGGEGFTTGTLFVTVPKGAPKIAPTTLRLAPPGQAAGANAPKGHLDEIMTAPVGTYDLLVDGSKEPFASVVIQGDKQSTLTLPVLAPIPFKAAPKPADRVPVTFDFGPAAHPTNESAWHLELSLLPDELVYDHTLFESNLGLLLAPGGSYRIERSAYAENPGWSQQVLATLDVPKNGAAVHTLPAVSDGWYMPSFDAPSAMLEVSSSGSDFAAAEVSLSWNCEPLYDLRGNFKTCAPWGCGFQRVDGSNAIFSAGVAPKKKVSGKFLAHEKCVYQLVGLASGDVAIDVKQPKSSLKVGYVDVEDVEVVHENGTKRRVKGTFTLSRVLGPGQNPAALNGAWPTGTAVPVAPGTYLVEVKYQNNAQARSYTETIVVP